MSAKISGAFAGLFFLCGPVLFLAVPERTISGVPLWFLSAVGWCLILAAFTMYVVYKRWDLSRFIIGSDDV